ncbi:MAG: hypothetical protein ACYDCQ_13020 [Dehalococcoidia bacterium]
MTYSVWETDSANIIGTFDTERDALALVSRIADSMGAEYVDSFSLTRTAEDGAVAGIAAGPELVSLARRQISSLRRLA